MGLLIDNIDTYKVINIKHNIVNLNSLIFHEGEDFIIEENKIKFKDYIAEINNESLIIDLRNNIKKFNFFETENIATKIYNYLRVLKDININIDVVSQDNIITIERSNKSSETTIQKIIFNAELLHEFAYINAPKNKVIFIFKFKNNKALYLDFKKLEFISGKEKNFKNFGHFRFLFNPFKQIVLSI